MQFSVCPQISIARFGSARCKGKREREIGRGAFFLFGILFLNFAHWIGLNIVVDQTEGLSDTGTKIANIQWTDCRAFHLFRRVWLSPGLMAPSKSLTLYLCLGRQCQAEIARTMKVIILVTSSWLRMPMNASELCSPFYSWLFILYYILPKNKYSIFNFWHEYN